MSTQRRGMRKETNLRVNSMWLARWKNAMDRKIRGKMMKGERYKEWLKFDCLETVGSVYCYTENDSSVWPVETLNYLECTDIHTPLRVKELDCRNLSL